MHINRIFKYLQKLLTLTPNAGTDLEMVLLTTAEDMGLAMATAPVRAAVYIANKGK
jgi:hypothetical protein